MRRGKNKSKLLKLRGGGEEKSMGTLDVTRVNNMKGKKKVRKARSVLLAEGQKPL